MLAASIRKDHAERKKDATERLIREPARPHKIDENWTDMRILKMRVSICAFMYFSSAFGEDARNQCGSGDAAFMHHSTHLKLIFRKVPCHIVRQTT